MTAPNLYAEAVVEPFRFGEYLIAPFECGRDVDLQCTSTTNNERPAMLPQKYILQC